MHRLGESGTCKAGDAQGFHRDRLVLAGEAGAELVGKIEALASNAGVGASDTQAGLLAVGHRVFGDEHLVALEKIMQDVCDDFGVTLVEFNGEAEHVHLLVEYPPTVQVSRLVNSLKGVSSRLMRRDFPDLVRHYWRAKRLWSESYYVGSVGGAPLEVVRHYIENQNRPPSRADSPPA